VTGPGAAAFAGGLARRGIEPSLPLAYLIFFNETIGAICLMIGRFTRPITAIYHRICGHYLRRSFPQWICVHQPRRRMGVSVHVGPHCFCDRAPRRRLVLA
jgi:hypothetical protein